MGGTVKLVLPADKDYKAEWFDPREGSLQPVSAQANGIQFESPGGQDSKGHPWDWVLVLS